MDFMSQISAGINGNNSIKSVELCQSIAAKTI